MIRIDKNEILQELNLRPFGAQNWLQNRNESCPFCQKKK
jgi:hypothetical protein